MGAVLGVALAGHQRSRIKPDRRDKVGPPHTLLDAGPLFVLAKKALKKQRFPFSGKRKYTVPMQPHLHPQDVVVALKLTLHPGLTIQKLADSLGLSLSAVHRSVSRAKTAGLLRADRRPVRHAIREFVLHGLRYAFPAVRGGMTPGMPTAYATLPLSEQIHAGVDPIPVWPDSSGEARGESLEPLCPSVPAAARADTELYQLLALIDAVRSGRARERKLAEEHLTRLLDG